MVNSLPPVIVGRLVVSYLALTLATLLALGVLTTTAPQLASTEAWVHAVIVAIFAVVLTARWRAARDGSGGAIRAVGIIAAVLAIVNIVEAAVGIFPGWMRVEMIVIAALMVIILVLIIRTARATVDAGDRARLR